MILNTKIACLLVFLVVFAFLPNGQAGAKAQSSFSKQWEIRHDNDFVLFSDKYYSSGVYLGYRQTLENSFLKKENRKEQLYFLLGQEIYTPSNFKSNAVADFDRPFAGYTGLSSTWSSAGQIDYYKVDLNVGVAGPASGAGAFHRWYHKTIVTSAGVPTWESEIANAFHATVYATYLREWQASVNPFSVYVFVKPQLAFGTREVFAQPEVGVQLGRRNKLQESMVYGQLKSTEREVFVVLSLGYRRVFHDALIAGFGDNGPFTLKEEANRFYGSFNLEHRFSQNDYKFGYRYTTKSTILATSHHYLSFSYARMF